MKIQVLVFMSEMRPYTKTIKFSVSFMLLFTIIKLLPALRLTRQKTNLFSSHFASIWSCLACLVGIIFGGHAVLPLDN